MAVRRSSAFFFILVVLAVVAAGWLLFKGSGAEPPAPPAYIPSVPPMKLPAPAPAPGNPAPKPGLKVKLPPPRPKAPPPPPIESVPATRDGCLDFLRRQAAAAPPPKPGTIVPTWATVRMDALDALLELDPAAAEPLVLQALGGDGDPSWWGDERLHAAGLRIRAGKADGAETVQAFLKSGEDLSGEAGEAALAASWMPAADGSAVVRRLLAEKLDDFDEDRLAQVLQAAATLGAGAGAEELRRIYDGNGGKGDDAGDFGVGGAAAGALARLGDGAAKGLPSGLEGMDAEAFAGGLGARGNEAAIPLLEKLLHDEDGGVRAAAVRALAAVGGAKAAAAIQGVLKDEEDEVRDWAAVSLALPGGGGDLAPVRAAAGSKDSDLSVAAWKALALRADPAARDAAGKLLTSGTGQPEPDREAALRKRIWAAMLMVRTTK